MNPTIGKEAILEVGGKKYKLARFDRAVFNKFLQWADTRLGHPLDAIKERLKDFPPKIQEYMVKDALDRAALRRSFNSPEVQSLLTTPEGSMKVLYLLFQKNHPEMTEVDVERLYEQAAEEHGYGYVERKLTEAEGTMPEAEGDKERRALQEMGALPADPEKKG